MTLRGKIPTAFVISLVATVVHGCFAMTYALLWPTDQVIMVGEVITGIINVYILGYLAGKVIDMIEQRRRDMAEAKAEILHERTKF